ncbi:Crp/Fnr family transcriptional regulator [Pedobacter antarcticus]|uniref:Cyclic nucleotide-binding protein n=2 Tax=Pedobacter antarcticus TaxID=34086 RepID=A0A081PEL7_9SPHI|nr:Crp/Fnr family transcriptional regulator [Pedobacter antarcticus]KEQ29140.1 cyclic nucleotide-binding protein [Pedobacter antarcticus 4BY]SDM36813.1 cAMP-binding domain of CRP or a regulatory subunit of cAMP-dependent protein kinases [Pedobacter antarcticus]SFE95001.1 cAMP-binding domain of CRP or a regulatory subunit of cAMP-dependent protein kinases [Pedobacter antarcticus]
MQELTDYILQIGNINKQQIELVESKTAILDLKKDAYFSEAGLIPKRVGFVLEGVMRGCYYNNKGEEITRCFIGKGNLVVDYPNFEANTASSEYLQACTDCKIIVFSKTDWEELSNTIVGWDVIKNKMVQQCLYQKSRKSPVISQDATTRYLAFLKNYPSFANRIPLAYIASFLGVTQQSLSRIRKNIR